ncbi:MAG: hypothetical protein ACFFBD_05265, partial [Candidatus Hodarchaeota archaeon]
DNVNHIGDRDKELMLMAIRSDAAYYIDKAEKWLYVKNNVDQSFYYLVSLVRVIAQIEVIINGQVPLREVILQALTLNPTFFKKIYTDLIHKKKDKEALQRVLALIKQYLDDKSSTIYRPILKYLADVGEERSWSELDQHFGLEKLGLGINYSVLAQEGIIFPTSSPIRITSKSTVKMEEPAYYYDGSVDKEV